MGERRAVNIVYISFSKALDTVTILLGNLRKCVLDKWTVRWIEKWLNNKCKRAIMAQGLVEDLLLVVPPKVQWLGTVLFNRFISDLDERADASSLSLLTTPSWEVLLEELLLQPFRKTGTRWRQEQRTI
ncbi:hypothetical protein TURU_095598 [Turdus rufiventris]|nr:hypothetical protein TURU_095598 [Turdus rufiventris]